MDDKDYWIEFTALDDNADEQEMWMLIEAESELEAVGVLNSHYAVVEIESIQEVVWH